MAIAIIFAAIIMAARKKKSKSNVVLWVILLTIAAMSFFVYRWWLFHQAEMVRYPAFKISIPKNYLIHGIDVSRYQQIIAWEEVKDMQVEDIKIGFAFIKATEGVGNIDVQFKRNWRRTKKAGMPRGAYHFFIASKDGKLQAENFIKAVNLEKDDLPPVLDVEQINGVSVTTLKKEVKAWLKAVEEYYGVRPIIYTNVDFYEKKLGSEFDGYPLWIAHYFQPGKPRIKRDWTIWQHSEQGRVNGILSKVDFNVFNGDSTDFRELLVR